MLARPLAFAAALALLAIAPAAVAQDTDPEPAPPLSPTVNVLYAHSVSGSTDHTMDTVAVRTDNNPGTSNLVDGDFTWTMTLTPPLDRTVVLDAAKTVDFTVYLGGSQSLGRVSVTTALKSGEQVVAQGAAKDLTITPSGASPAPVNKYGTVTWTAAVELATIPPGPLVWTVTASGSASAVFMGMSESRGRSAITLPVLSTSGGGAQTVQHELTGTAPTLQLNATSPTNATHVYNWTGPATPLQLRLAGDVVGGNATVVVVDGANSTLANVTFAGNATRDITGAAGNWTITVTLRSFVGNLTASLGPQPVQGPGGPGAGPGTGTTTGTTTGPDGNGTGNETGSGGGKDAPAPTGPLIATGLLATVALALRRRRMA